MFYLQEHPDKEFATEMLQMSRIQIEAAIEGSVVAYLNNRRGTGVLLTSVSALTYAVPQIDPEEQLVLEIRS
jgi:hypothetical protein